MNDDYSDIINLEHHKSENYPWMPDEDRAAQFAPFAALVGFSDIIRRTAEQHERKFETRNTTEFD